MKILKITICAGLILAGSTFLAKRAATKPGAGNAAAIALGKKSPIVQSAYQFLLSQAARIEDAKLRKETLDALGDPCIHHRANLTDARRDAIVATLTTQGLVNPADAAAIVGGVKAGIFPPVINDGSACPQLPQAFYSAPGSTSVNGHHSYPGGLVVHESNNDVADVHLAQEYRQIYGHSGAKGLPTVPRENQGHFAAPEGKGDPDIFIDEDLIIGAPLWHDWAKPIVFQWNANDPGYLLNFRNPVFSFLTGERLMIIYAEKGSDGVRVEVQKVRDAGAI